MNLALIFALTAVLIAWPLPLILSRWRVLWAHPVAAMLLWQALAATGVIALVGAPLAYALAPLGPTFSAAFTRLTREGFFPLLTQLPGPQLASFVVALVITAHLFATCGATVYRLQTQFRQQKNIIRLIAERAPEKNTYLVEAQTPLAYCLPGLLRPLTVVSTGLRQGLRPAQWAAVIAHEQAHIRQHHHLLLAAFYTWQQALPWLPVTTVAQQAVSTLVEILADRATLVHHRREDLLAAIVTAADPQAADPESTDTESTNPQPVDPQPMSTQPADAKATDTQSADGQSVATAEAFDWGPRLQVLLAQQQPRPGVGAVLVVAAVAILVSTLWALAAMPL